MSSRQTPKIPSIPTASLLILRLLTWLLVLVVCGVLPGRDATCKVDNFGSAIMTPVLPTLEMAG